MTLENNNNPYIENLTNDTILPITIENVDGSTGSLSVTNDDMHYTDTSDYKHQLNGWYRTYEQSVETSVTNTTVETTIIDDTTPYYGSINVSANTFRVGSIIRFVVRGEIDNFSAAHDITFRLYHNSTLMGTITWDLPDITSTNDYFRLYIEVLVTSIGAGGTVRILGEARCRDGGGMHASGNGVEIQLIDTTGSYNTTVAGDLDLTAQWSGANAANILTIKSLQVNNLM